MSENTKKGCNFMKKLSQEELLSISGGAKHYHWKCSVNGFVSTGYKTAAGAGGGMDKHIDNYPTHASKTTVQYCTNSLHSVINK